MQIPSKIRQEDDCEEILDFLKVPNFLSKIASAILAIKEKFKQFYRIS
jgi:hypothetical protein